MDKEQLKEEYKKCINSFDYWKNTYVLKAKAHDEALEKARKEFENKLLDTCYGWLYCEASGCEKYIKESANSLLEIAVKKFNSAQDAPFEQKCAWSAEDEFYYDIILYILNNERIKKADKETIRWFKYFKDRMQSQSTWKPSLAQLNALSIVSKGNAPDDIEAIVSLYNDLKKLK